MASDQSNENDYLVSHPGQCCDGYCVEDLNVHGEETRGSAVYAAAAAEVLVSRAVKEALAPVVAVLDEYAASCNPGPFTSERALYERLRAVTTPPGEET